MLADWWRKLCSGYSEKEPHQPAPSLISFCKTPNHKTENTTSILFAEGRKEKNLALAFFSLPLSGRQQNIAPFVQNDFSLCRNKRGLASLPFSGNLGAIFSPKGKKMCTEEMQHDGWRDQSIQRSRRRRRSFWLARWLFRFKEGERQKMTYACASLIHSLHSCVGGLLFLPRF